MEQPLSLFTLPWYIFVRFASPVAAAAAAARSVFELDQLALRSLLQVSYLTTTFQIQSMIKESREFASPVLERTMLGW